MLDEATKRRLQLLKSLGAEELADEYLSRATCSAHGHVRKALTKHDSARTWRNSASSTEEGNGMRDEVMSQQQRRSLEVLDALGQLGCSWGTELVRWRNERKSLVLKELNWLHNAVKQLKNVLVDDGDDGNGHDEDDHDVDHVEIRRVEGLIRDQALAWLLCLKTHWEWLYKSPES